jgi:aspartokinase/homoserine dehydrogenase 1
MKEVHKFGGTSVDKLDQVVKVIISRKEENPYVAVSAFSGFTDQLLALIKDAEAQKVFSQETFDNFVDFHFKKIKEGVELESDASFLQDQFLKFFQERSAEIQEAYNDIVNNGYSAKSHDKILGFGEQISAFVVSQLLTLRLKSEEKKGKFVDLGKIIQLPVQKADKAFLEALRAAIAKEIVENKEDNEILVMTGFLGEIPGGILYSIDRGYTDFTGALAASILHAKRYIIFKEVDGVCSADPRIVQKGCLLLKELSYTEVLKMASGGMKAVNTEAVKPAMKSAIPIEVRNTLTPNQEGTKIVASREMQKNRKIQNIPVKKDVCIVRFGGYNDGMEENLEEKLIHFLDKHRIKKFFSTTDGAGTSVVLPWDEKKIEMLIDDLQVFATTKLMKNCAIVAVVGEEMRGRVGVISTAAQALASKNISIKMIAQGASEIGIDFVVNEEEVNDAIAVLHEAFFS